ncbi:MAG: divalent-cation tolerance protein CutA [Burkholderiales bacterium]|nr:divalent-cation tolerance protein CutA [Burkholderiales bacterium]
MEPHLLLISSFPDLAGARRFAQALLEQRLAACVNLLGPCTSMYRWQGAIETAEEVPILIKTRASLYPGVEAELRRLHPYDVPELLALPVEGGLPRYLDWIDAETQEAGA